MKSIDHVGETNRQADVDDLLSTEMTFEVGVGHVIYWLETCGFLRIANNCSFLAREDTVGQRVICEMPHFFVRNSKPPTEGYMRGYSIETVVDGCSRHVGKFTVLRGES